MNRAREEEKRGSRSIARRRGLPLALALGLCAALALWLVADEREPERTTTLALPRVRPPGSESAASGPSAVESAGPQPSARERAPLPAPRPHTSLSAGDPRAGASARIEGRVLLADDGSPRAGLDVLACEGEREPELAWTAAALAARAPGVHTTTDAEGGFVLEGLDPERVYTLLVGGGGLVGTQPKALVRPGTEERKITVEQLYGALLALREVGGGELRLSERLEDAFRGRVSVQRPRAQRLASTPALALLAGLDLELLASEALGRRVLLFTAPLSEERLRPIHFRAELPGYHGLDLELEARPVQHGLAEHSAELIPSAPGFGALRIRLTGWSGDCPPFASSTGAAAHLSLRGPRGQSASFELDPFEASEIVVDGLPYGAWSVDLFAVTRALLPRREKERQRELVIGSTPAIYPLDLSSSSALVLELRRIDGSPFRGRASLLVARVGPGDARWRVQHQVQPPYRIDDLEPGHYRIVLQSPFPAGTSTARPLAVELGGGRCTHVELREE